MHFLIEIIKIRKKITMEQTEQEEAPPSKKARMENGHGAPTKHIDKDEDHAHSNGHSKTPSTRSDATGGVLDKFSEMESKGKIIIVRDGVRKKALEMINASNLRPFSFASSKRLWER